MQAIRRPLLRVPHSNEIKATSTLNRTTDLMKSTQTTKREPDIFDILPIHVK
jgi:hypothetical protein